MKKPESKSVRVRKLNTDDTTATSLVIPIKVNCTKVNAFVDLAAEVTVMSSQFA